MVLTILAVFLPVLGGGNPAYATQISEEAAQKPATGGYSVDYAELKRQIAIVNGLNSYDYTRDTWTPLQTALNEGKVALDRLYGQKAVNSAAEKIKTAVAALVRMDYTDLENARSAAYELIKENPELYDVWTRLDAALEESKSLLVSGDQAAVDSAAEKLNALMEERLSYIKQEEAPPTVVVQEVQVEVPPADDYCNIPMHHTWPVLLAASAALNVVLLVLIVYILMKKKNTVDDTPLVYYDIDEDM